jgi:hypothetical protein
MARLSDAPIGGSTGDAQTFGRSAKGQPISEQVEQGPLAFAEDGLIPRRPISQDPHRPEPTQISDQGVQNTGPRRNDHDHAAGGGSTSDRTLDLRRCLDVHDRRGVWKGGSDVRGGPSDGHDGRLNRAHAAIMGPCAPT